MKNVGAIDAEVNKDCMGERYERAQYLLRGIWTNKIAFNDVVFPNWIGSTDCFWYERTLKSGEGETAIFGKEYRLVDAAAETNTLAFDHRAFAAALAKAAGEDVDVFDLPVKNVELSINPLTVSFTAFEKRWAFDSQSETCTEHSLIPDHWLPSPDGKKVVFTREHNIWVRDLSSGDEHALTQDGENYYAYGVASTPIGVSIDTTVLPQAQWSPDSRWVFTVQCDARQVKASPIVHHVPKDGSVRPRLEQVKIALPGDEHIETIRLLAIHVETGRVQAADYPQIQTISPGVGFFTDGRSWWGADSRCIYFVDVERGYKKVQLVEWNVDTGTTRVLFEEISETHISLNLHYDDRPTLLPLPESNELLWYSERSGWAHLYLYDLKTGQLKHPVTQGEWLVREVLSFDTARREVYVRTAGRGANSDGSAPNDDRDPYYCDLARIHVDTGEITTLAASDHEYFAVSMKNFSSYVAVDMGRDAKWANSVSPTGNFAVLTRSRADEVPVSLVVDRECKQTFVLETADISALPDDWQWPEPVKLLAADGRTDIYGLVFRPSHFSSEQSYPVVTHVINSPELSWVSKGSFSNGALLNWMYLDAAALAELGFIVVQIEGRGTPLRHKAFHDESYGDYSSANNLDDHVAGIQQLAERYPYMDLTRVGITAHLAGGSAGVKGLIQHPDFYSVGVNGVLVDPRLMPACVTAEKFEGMSAPSYQPIEEQVEKLRGKLLLVHGLLDTGVPATTTLRLVEALHKANKDFDLLLLPNLGHTVWPGYLIRRVWDFLVRYLLEIDPPKAFELTYFGGGYSPPVSTDEE